MNIYVSKNECDQLISLLLFQTLVWPNNITGYGSKNDSDQRTSLINVKTSSAK